jgi:hypothetical protein
MDIDPDVGAITTVILTYLSLLGFITALAYFS